MAGGRPSKFDPEKLPAIKKLYECGCTDTEVAKVLNLNIDTIKEWKAKKPEFSTILKSSKDLADDAVELSLYKRALGGMKRRVQKLDSNGEIRELWEELAPDPTSMIFWLKNRRREQWRDRQDLEHAGHIELRAVIKDREPKKIESDG